MIEYLALSVRGHFKVSLAHACIWKPAQEAMISAARESAKGGLGLAQCQIGTKSHFPPHGNTTGDTRMNNLAILIKAQSLIRRLKRMNKFDSKRDDVPFLLGIRLARD
jgi:hypothetical protein